MHDLSLFLGHSNAAAVTREEAIRWKDHLIAEGYSPTTVRSSLLGAPRAVFSAAQDALLISHNPFRSIRVPKSREGNTRAKGFTDEEARTILIEAMSAAGNGPNGVAITQCRKWAPWLMAFTGARIGEIAQLRSEDIHQDGDIWCVRITPDAGQVKTDTARCVPLHPQLLQLGFLDFVADSKGPRLFQPLVGANFRNRSDLLSKWIRSIGVTDPRVHPNHGWRHRFKTLCRHLNIAAEYHNAITGHTNQSAGTGTYGDYPTTALYREICKLPWVRVSA